MRQKMQSRSYYRSGVVSFPHDGDESAVARFWSDLQDRVSKLARKWGNSEDDVEELTGNVMLRLQNPIPRASVTTSPYRWAYIAMALRSEIKELHRKRKQETEGLENFARFARTASDPELASRCRDLNEAMEALPANERQLVVDRFIDGRSIQELADGQRISYFAAAQRLTRIIAKLRNSLR